MPRVSIGMPVHNGEKHLRNALDSLVKQHFTDFELIISDNASTDMTAVICEEYARKDNRIRYYRNDANKGAIYNFNRVLELARGEYFMWAAHDDTWSPAFISELIDKLSSSANHVLAFCRFNVVDDSGNVVIKPKVNWPGYFDRSRLSRMASMISLHYSTQKACIIYGLMKKKYLLKDRGLYKRQDDKQGCDIITLLRLLSYGPFAFTDKLLFQYKYREAPPSQRMENVADMNFKTKNKIFIKILKNLIHVRINILYKPLNYSYYDGLNDVIKEAPVSRIEKIMLNTVVVIERHFEPSKIFKLFHGYWNAIFKKD